ncbi:thioesterase family protein [Desulfuromonas acetoxidans]|uniref:Thioesterase superfamily n=1 Tax=Desulfuromonas acetoxidans (strain DSM 684 / 11070) TaxID=281689 RepID=Q1K393_DESA6|nr:acyl-CoA thioesterase [Desulfuromonas acetoxidans]EAT17081.1 thioesterase superfamily [Desulfuromonas acetoxidans DSM 684]
MTQSVAPYEMPIIIQPQDIDLMGHVNNIVYLRWVQDVATAHWNHAATDEEKAGLLWMVTRHEIDYLRQVFAEDKLIARTWVGKAQRRRFERHTEIRREQDGKVVAKALTWWFPVDHATKKPTTVAEEVRARFAAQVD